MRKKRIVRVFLTVLLAALASSPIWANGTQEVTDGTVRISMWTHDDLYRQYFQKRVDMLNEVNPERKIVLDTQIMPNPVTSLIPASLAGEEIPDLIGVEQGTFPLLMENDLVDSLLLDLTDKIGDRYNDFVQGRWALYTNKGHIYGLESALTASVYYYQPAIFEKYGVKVPETWDEYIQAGKKLAEHGISIGVMDNDASGLFSLLFLQRGGQFFNEKGKFVFDQGMNRQYAVEVLTLLREAMENHSLLVVLGGDFWGSTIPSAFSSGKLAGMVAPDWYNTSCLQPGVESMAGQWRVAPLPLWGDQGYKTSVWGGTGFGITRSSKVADVVWELLDDAYMSFDGQIDRYKTIGFFPTMYKALSDPTITEAEHPFFGGQKIGSILSEVARETPPLWQSSARPFLMQAMIDKLPSFIDGTLNPDEFIDAVSDITRRDAKL